MLSKILVMISMLALIVSVIGTYIIGGFGVYTMLLWGYVGVVYISVLAIIAATRAAFVAGMFKRPNQKRSEWNSMLLLGALVCLVCIGGIIFKLKVVAGWGVFHTIQFWVSIGAAYILVLAIIAAIRMITGAHNKKGLGTASQPPQP